MTLLASPHKRKVRAGKRLKIAWHKRQGEFRFVESVSRDRGQTWQFVTATREAKRNAYVRTVPDDAVTDEARLRVVVWAQADGVPDTEAGAFVRSARDSKPFRITP